MHLTIQNEKTETGRTCKFAKWTQGTRQDLSSKCSREKCAGKSCERYRSYRQEVENCVSKAQRGDSGSFERLMTEFKNYVFQMDKRYFIPGGDREDLYQEGFIGLFQAIRTYQPNDNLSFEDYVSLQIRNSVIRAIRTATQKKQLLLTGAKSIFDKSVLDMRGYDFDPEDMAIKSIAAERISSIVDSKLSSRECKMLEMKVSGFSADEIAIRFKTDKKVVDNALYRARMKIKKHMSSRVRNFGPSIKFGKFLAAAI